MTFMNIIDFRDEAQRELDELIGADDLCGEYAVCDGCYEIYHTESEHVFECGFADFADFTDFD